MFAVIVIIWSSVILIGGKPARADTKATQSEPITVTSITSGQYYLLVQCLPEPPTPHPREVYLAQLPNGDKLDCWPRPDAGP